jgi:hypothetical protein
VRGILTKLLRPGRSVVTLSIMVLAASLVIAGPAGAAVCADTTPGLLARWPGDGTTAEVAHGRDGTLVLGTTYEAGTVGQAFSFDGDDDQVSVSDDPDWTIDGDFTIDTWVKMDDLSGESKVFVGQSGGKIAPKWIFWRRDDGQLGFLYGDGVSGVDAVMYPWTPTLGQWYHVAVTRSGSTFTLYVDGSVVASATWSAPIVDVEGPLTLGSAQNEFFLQGALDEPEIHQRALSGDQIDAIHDAGSTARCAITRSTLTLTGPGTAYPSETVTLNGTLGLSGGASVDAKAVAIHRTIDGGSPTSLPDVTTAADGSFSFQDAPGAGTVVYRATYAGETNVSSENAFATVAVGKQASALSVAMSSPKVKLGERVTIVAHLNGGDTNRTVSIWAVPYGGSKQRLVTAEVNASGNLSVRHRPTRETEYYATFGGDVAWKSATSTSKTVHVVPRWVVRVVGGYATVGGVRLYHYSARCSRSSATSCPAATFVLEPRHPNQRVSFQGRYCHQGRCVKDNSSFRLDRRGTSYVWIYYGDRSIIGWRLYFRLIFEGDADHLGATSTWVRTKVTA